MASSRTQAAGVRTLGPATGFRPLADGLEVEAGGAVIRITALRDDIVRVRIGPQGRLPEDASWAVLERARRSSVSVQPVVDPRGGAFSTTAMVVRVERSPLRLVVEDRQGRVISADALDGGVELRGAGFVLRKALAAESRWFGLGDKAGPFDRRGQTFQLWNSDAYGFQEASDPLYKAIPFVIEADGEGRCAGLFFDDTFRSWFDFGRTDPDVMSFGAAGGPIDYYVMAGPDPKAVVQAWAWLTGPAPLPPLWSLGFQQSRYSYMSQAEALAVGERLRRERIPADAIYLDIDYQDRRRPFTVDQTAFPDLPELVAGLKALDLKLVLITDLHIAEAPGQAYAPYETGKTQDQFVKRPDGSDYVGEVWPGPCVFPDFTRRPTRAWWGGLYRDFAAMGVAGFWNDMNEPAIFKTPSRTMPADVVHRIEEPGFETRTAAHAEIHNVYGMQNSRATFEGLLTLEPERRPFVLTRASYAGGHRYAATWTGDNGSTWNHLRLMTPMLLNLGLSGFAFAGADVGGFTGSPSPDLLTRWIQVAAFTPLFRDHTDRETPPQEPWVHGEAHTGIRRRYIEERYRLMPYLYALADEAARTGLPLMRPVFLEFPAALAFAADPGGQFLLGPSLLVAPPPFGEQPCAFDVRLPGAGWFDYWTGRRVRAEADASDPDGAWRVVRETPAPLERLPVYVRPGTILPRQPLVQSTAQTPDGPLELHIYPGAAGTGALYWDDGWSLRNLAGDYLRQAVSFTSGADGLTLAFARREGGHAPWWTAIEVVVHGWERPTARAALDGQSVAATVDAAAETLRVLLPDLAGPAVLQLT
jgi:alpha-glucosidase